MLFNSSSFLFGFLPACLVGFYSLAKVNREWAKIYLLLASLIFYGWSSTQYLPLLAASVAFNYYIGSRIQSLLNTGHARAVTSWCSFGIFVNVAFLIYFKYTIFFFDNINIVLGTELKLHQIILPLGISFYSFQRIAYLIDCARGEIKRANP